MTSGRPIIIETRGLGKVYGIDRAPIVALKDISFAVEEGSFVSLVGPSGCGKSTLLQMLAGLVPSTSGEVIVDGVAVRQPAPDKISVMFQDATLLPWKRVADNVEFPLEIRGMKATERRQRAAAMLSLVGLSEFAERKVLVFWRLQLTEEPDRHNEHQQQRKPFLKFFFHFDFETKPTR